MKTALLCTAGCGSALATARCFAAAGMPVDLVVAETRERTRNTATQEAFKATHAAFSQELARAGKRNRVSGFSPAKRAFLALPGPLRRGLLAAANLYLRRRWASRLGVPVRYVEKISSERTRDILLGSGIATACLCSSHWLIRPVLIDTPGLRIISVHPAKLPEHRALDSLGWSLLAGDPLGNTAHLIDAGVDTGAILFFEPYAPRPGDTVESLRKLFREAKPGLFLKAVRGLADGSVVPTPQVPDAGVHHRPLALEELVRAQEALEARIAVGQQDHTTPNSQGHSI